MTNPENTRLLGDERGALEAETALAREEQKLWQRLDASLSDALDKRAQALATRIGAVEQTADASSASELARARAVVAGGGGNQPDPLAAGPERSNAVQARRGALQARELALKALTSAIAQIDTAKAARAKELDQAEQLVVAVEKAAKNAAELARNAAEAARKAEEAAKAEAAKKAKEAEKEAQKEAARRAAFEADSAKTAPMIAPVAKAEARAEPKTEPGIPVAKAAPKAAPLVAAAPTTTSGTLRKISRRRRVRIAPPPKKLEVEVAEYGDNNFYTGFDPSIAQGGLFVTSLETLQPGYELDLEIDLEGRKIATRGKVEFIRTDNLANPECTQGAGLRLLNLSRDAQTSIEAFFQKRPPMFFMNV